MFRAARGDNYASDIHFLALFSHEKDPRLARNSGVGTWKIKDEHGPSKIFILKKIERCESRGPMA